jgi:hypothetical protein
MGRLSGFKYRDVVQKLRSFGFLFDRQVPAVTKSGGTRNPGEKSHFRIIPAI